MPWVSTFACLDSPPGDGGGVSATRPEDFGRDSSKRRAIGRDGEKMADVELECVRLTFFAGWWASLVEGGERADDREAPGRWMPSDGSDNDLRRVL